VPGEKLEYHVRPLFQALVAELAPVVGQARAEELADLAFGATKDGIYAAIRTAHEEAGLKKQMKRAYERIVSRHTRSDGAGVPEIVTAIEDGDVVRVERDGRAEMLPPEAVEQRWPVVIERVAEKVPTERWTVHYPKDADRGDEQALATTPRN
jgi:hypothetical protein